MLKNQESIFIWTLWLCLHHPSKAA